MNRFVQWALAPFGGLWLGINSLRNQMYAKKGPSQRLPRPVVSIGNVTWGGTGKTPLIGWLAKTLADQGVKVGILSRGYGGRNLAKPLLVGGPGIQHPPWQETGDEPLLLAQMLPGTVIARCSDREKAGLLALKNFPDIQVFLLDDGLQHRRLHRDLEIVLLPRRSSQLRWPPLGELREPLRPALDRADLVIKSMAGCAFPGGITRGQKVFMASKAQYIVDPQGQTIDQTIVKESKWALITGIASPQRVYQDLIQLGAKSIQHLVFPDHHAFKPQDVEQLALDWLPITTAKDAIRWPQGLPKPYILSHGVELMAPGAEKTLQKVRNLL